MKKKLGTMDSNSKTIEFILESKSDHLKWLENHIFNFYVLNTHFQPFFKLKIPKKIIEFSRNPFLVINQHLIC